MLSRRPDEQHISLTDGQQRVIINVKDLHFMRIYAPTKPNLAKIRLQRGFDTYHQVRLASFRVFRGSDDIPEAKPIATAVLTAIPLYMKQLCGRKAF